MTAGRRLLNFAFVLLNAAAVWVLAQSLWPYLELVAPVGALVVLLFAVNIIDGIWFAIRNRRRFALAVSTTQRPGIGGAGKAGASRAQAVGLSGTR
jgi:hypothetical protein